MRASVIVPHYEDHDRLANCLSALVPQLKRHPDVELVVVDNNSPSGLEKIERDFPMVRFLIEPEKGAAAARNTGVNETETDYLFFIDADCIAAPGWLDRAVELCTERLEVVGGHVGTFDETPPPRSGAEAFETVFAFNFKYYIEKLGFTGSGNMVTTRAIFEDVGGFVVGVSEDKDWSQRARAKGYSITYDEALRVDHPTRRDWPALKRKWRRLTDEAFLLNGTGIKARFRWGLRALLVFSSGIAHVTEIASSPKLAGSGERLAAMGTLIAIRWVRSIWMVQQVIAPPSASANPPGNRNATSHNTHAT